MWVWIVSPLQGLKAGGQTAAWGVEDFDYLSGDDAHVYVGGNQTGSSGAGHQMADDDHDYSVAGFPLKVEFPLTPDTGHLTGLLKPVYIVPEYSGLADYSSVISFGQSEWNLDDDRFNVLFGANCGAKQPANVPHGHSLYWCAYLLGGFQPTAAEDGDPNEEGFCGGFLAPGTGGGVLCLETIRDHRAYMTVTGRTPPPESWYVAHEVGHILGLPEAPVHVGGKILARNGNQLTLEGLLTRLGFVYLNAMLESMAGDPYSDPVSGSRILVYANNPEDDCCYVNISIVWGTPSVGEYYQIWENSIMCQRADFWKDGMFAPRDQHAVRSNTESPVRP